MAGLMNAGQQPDAPQTYAPSQDSQNTEGQGETPNVTPEEQALYSKFVTTCVDLIYQPKVLPAVLIRLGLAPAKAQAIAAQLGKSGAGGSPDAQRAPPAPGGAEQQEQTPDQESAGAERSEQSAPPAPAQPSGLTNQPQQAQGKGDPVADLAATAVGIVRRVVHAAQQAGQQLDASVLLSGGEEVVEDLAHLATDAGIHDFFKVIDKDGTPTEVEAAFYRAVDMFRQQGMADGSINGEALKQDFAQLQQADQSGTVDQLVPGIGKAAQSLAPQGARPT